MQLPYRHIHYKIYARSVIASIPKVRFDDSFVIRKFTFQDVPEVAKINRPSEARLCAKRLASGYVGFSVLYNDHLAVTLGLILNLILILKGLKLTLNNLIFYAMMPYTSLPFRGRGIQTSLVSARLRTCRELGYHRAIGYIERQNRPSIRVWEKVGGVCIGDIDYVRVGTWRWKKYRSRTLQ